MGRELRRVPLDFDWPLDKTWAGFVNPHWTAVECGDCGGTGLNPATRRIDADWYDHEGFGSRWTYDYGVAPDGSPAERPPWRIIGVSRRWQHRLTEHEVQALIDGGRLMDFTHTWTPGVGWVANDPQPVAADIVDAVNDWSRRGIGHDCINRHICVRARASRLGVYGRCSACDGRGYVWPSEADRARYEAWEETPPPEGDGWQVWEDVSEGSPVSPVFADRAGLVDWLIGEGYSRVAAENFAGSGWCPSMVMVQVPGQPTEFFEDIESCVFQSQDGEST